MSTALSFTWPQCLPTDLEKIVTPFRAAWMQLVMESPLVLHTFIFATTKQMLCLRGQREDDMSQLAARAPSLHQSLALSCARTEIESMSVPSDGMILAIIILATNGPRRQDIPPQSHPRSPLATTQSLHLFSMLGVVEAHARAVGELVELKGGLRAVETYGVRDTILLCVLLPQFDNTKQTDVEDSSDAYHSTILGKRPAQTWPNPVISLGESGLHTLDAEAEAQLLELGSGFALLKLNQTLLEVLQLMCDVTVALDHHVRQGTCPPNVSDIVLQRNAVQNKLLWLQPVKDDPLTSLDTVGNIVRIAANIFSDMVLFPLSPATGIKPRLAAELRRCLRYSIHDIEDDDPTTDAFLWSLTLGGIAAAFTRHRGWYVEQLAESYGHVLREPNDMLQRMGRFLWWGDVCDQPAKLLWTQALEVFNEENAASASAEHSICQGDSML